MLGGQVSTDLLTFEEYADLSPIHDRVVDLFATLHAYIGGVLGDDLLRVENVVSEDSRYERQDEGRLGCLLCFDVFPLVSDLGG